MEKTDSQNMPCWYYEKADLKKTPSFCDGINAETEARYRREGSRFIYDLGTRLGLHYNTIATGVVFFHRFYMFHSFKKFHRHVTATCCLFLAGKVEETPKKCKDLIKVAKALLNEAQFAQFGDDPKEEVLTFEKVLLQTIKFDLTVEHPYKYMLQYANGLKGDRSKIEKLVQMSWTFINDSLSTSLCLQWEPQIVAVAVMYLAGRLCKFEPQDWAYNRGRWWEQFIDDISIELLEDICHQVLDQYSHTKTNKPGSSKGKRERPKTPGDRDKTSEPQAKTPRSDGQKPSSQKPKPSQSTQKPHSSRSAAPPSNSKIHPPTSSSQRRGSSNTEVVAMDTVDTTDRGAIEQGKPPSSKAATTKPTTPASTSNAATPTKPPTSEQSSTLYNINQYQSFIGSTDQNSLGFMQQGGYTGSQFPPSFSGLPGTGQTTSVRQSFPAANASQQNFSSFSGSFDSNYHRFPHTPETGQNNYPHYGQPAGGQSSTGLATVRITGRRDQQGNQKWP